MMKEITEGGELLDGKGLVRQKGWSKRALLDYSREDVPAWRRLFRLKEWDTCVVGDDSVRLMITIADGGYAGVVSATVVDLERGTEHTCNRLIPFTFGSMELPRSLDGGDIMFRAKGVSLDISRSPGRRYVRFRMEDFDDVRPLYVNISMEQQQGDDLYTSVGYPEMVGGFCITCRRQAMPAEGTVVYGADRYELSQGESFADIYWGRGVLPRRSARVWMMASGLVDGRRVSICTGEDAGFVCVDGTGSRIETVSVQGLSNMREKGDIALPIGFRGADHSMELSLEGTQCHRDNRQLFSLIGIERRLVFGVCSGKVRLEDGSMLQVSGLNAVLCDIEALW